MHFIREYMLSDPSICDTIYDALKNLKSKGYGAPGQTFQAAGDAGDIDPNTIKESWDIMTTDFKDLYPKGPSEIGLDVVYNEIDQIIKPQYFNDIQLYFAGRLFSYYFPHFQLYEPGQGYKVWHVDAIGAKMHRQFVFILYLNDVPDGGTKFRDYDITVEAKKGKVLFFPANFCFVHRSEISYTSHKAIMTGWIDCNVMSILSGGE